MRFTPQPRWPERKSEPRPRSPRRTSAQSPHLESDRRDTTREPAQTGELPHEDDDVPGFSSRPNPRNDRWQKRCGASGSTNRGAWSTRSHRVEHVFPPGAGAGSRVRGAGDRSSRQAVAALEATRLQHGAPSAGGHTSAKAVLHRPALLVRLVRTLHERLLESAQTIGRWRTVDRSRRIGAGYGVLGNRGNLDSRFVDGPFLSTIHSLLLSRLPDFPAS